MNNYIKLAKTFVKANGMSETKDKGQKIKIVVLSLFSMIFILFPVIIGVGVFINVMTETLKPMGHMDFGVKLLFYILNVFSIIFGINIVFSEFYFSSDIEHILPLPLKASQIVGGKFLAIFFMENIMQFMLVLSCIIGYGLGSNMGIVNWIIAIVGVITLPILPLVYCAIFSMILMGLTKIIRNKDLIQRISVALVFVMLIVLVASIGSLQTLDISATIEAMATGNQTVYSILGIVFPNVYYFVKAMSSGSIGALIIYIVINIVAMVIMLALSEVLYFRGVIGLTSGETHGKAKDLNALLKKNKMYGQAIAYFMKEVRMLLRTPTFFTNCIAVNFIWPIFVYAVYKIQNGGLDIQDISRKYSEQDISIQLIFMLGIVGIAILITALNSISSNSISREGKHFSFMKYIPVDYRIQWNVKALVGAMFPTLGIVVFYIPICIWLYIPLSHMMAHLVLCIMAILFIAYMGIYIDSIQPKLIWDDELSSLRENYNTFFAMAIAIAYVAVMCVGGYFLFRNMKYNIWFSMGIVAIILIVSNVVIWLITRHAAIKNIEEQEEA